MDNLPDGAGEISSTWVFKNWGAERWLYNSDLYCGKVLTVLKGKCSSFHFHKLKTETFYINKGNIILTYGMSDDISKANKIVLGPTEVFHIPVGLRHRFEAVEDSEIIEFSTTHYDSDSYRIIPGD